MKVEINCVKCKGVNEENYEFTHKVNDIKLENRICISGESGRHIYLTHETGEILKLKTKDIYDEKTFDYILKEKLMLGVGNYSVVLEKYDENNI